MAASATAVGASFPGARRRRREIAFVSAWILLVGTAVVLGRDVASSNVALGAAPLVGTWQLRWQPGLVLAAALATSVIVWGPTLARRLRWVALLAVVGSSSALWTILLAAAGGWDRVTAPLTTRYEYEPYAASIDSARDFLDGFVAAVPDLPTHVRGHPPLATLVPWALDQVGLGGAGWFAILVIVAWGVATVAALVAARGVVGEGSARRAAPALVLLPAAVWAGTSADALFAGALAVGVALAVARPGERRWGLAGGLVLGVGLLLSYGAVLVLLLPAVVAHRRRRLDDLVAVGVGISIVLIGAAAAGFWWLSGLEATRDVYWDGVAARRPLAYLALVGNPAALALALGPAVAVGLARHRHLLVTTALAMVVVADLSLLSAGEVERIWLPFVPWLALALPGDDRRWLAAQAATAIALQLALRSPW